ncbi:hypothetical protein ADUPG1_002461, partial [Aduncisulcus paluster]
MRITIPGNVLHISDIESQDSFDQFDGGETNFGGREGGEEDTCPEEEGEVDEAVVAMTRRRREYIHDCYISCDELSYAEK